MLRQSMLATRTRAAGPSRLYAPGAISHRTPLRRTYTSSSSPSSKVTVVPFAQSPEQARERLLIHGLLGSGKMSNVLFAGLLRLFGRAFEPLGREFGLGESIILRDMKPVYWPIWRVDLVAEGMVGPAKGGPEHEAWLGVPEGYIPGNAFAPLSYISFAVPPLLTNLEPYNPARDLHQLGGPEIVEVPFDVNPFELLERARRRIGSNTVVDGVRIDERKWKETMVAAYPIMFPLYVAEFAYVPEEGETRRYTVVMDAHDENPTHCRVSFPPPEEVREARPRFAESYYVNPAPFLPVVHLMLPSIPGISGGGLTIGNTSQALPPAATAALEYSHWMSPAPTGGSVPASPTYSIAGGEIPWSDARIMPWGSEAHEENGEYIDKAIHVRRTIEALREMRSMTIEGDPMVTVGKFETGHLPTFSKDSLSNVQKSMEENERMQREELEEMKPQWLVEYDQAQAKAQQAQKTKAKGASG